MAFCLHKLVNVACFMKSLLFIPITNIDFPNPCFASGNKAFRMLKQILFSGFFCNYFFFSILTIMILIFYFIQCVTPYFVLEKPAQFVCSAWRYISKFCPFRIFLLQCHTWQDRGVEGCLLNMLENV